MANLRQVLHTPGDLCEALIRTGDPQHDQRRMPKANGKTRWLGIPTMYRSDHPGALGVGAGADLRSRLEPNSSRLRPRRPAQESIAEIDYSTTGNRSSEWVFEGDMMAGFDEIDHSEPPPAPTNH